MQTVLAKEEAGQVTTVRILEQVALQKFVKMFSPLNKPKFQIHLDSFTHVCI